MSEFMSLLFFLLCTIVGFFALVLIFWKLPQAVQRPWVLATVVIFAFFGGFYWPSSSHNDDSKVSVAVAPPPVTEGVAQTAVTEGGAVGAADVSHACDGLKSLPTKDAMGFLDRVESNGIVQPNPASLARGSRTTFSGWAADGSSKGPVQSVCLVVDGVVLHTSRTIYGTSRPDVATNLGSSSLTNVGYAILVPPRMLSPGAHRVTVLSIARNGAIGRLTGSWAIAVQ